MRSKQPKIGITLSETPQSPNYRWPSRMRFDYIKQAYYQAILSAGGIPVLLANLQPPSLLESLIQSIDGLLLTGGGDMHPFYYNQQPHSKLGEVTGARDNLEMMALSQLMKGHKPILGICRGHQVINIALGGTLFQDLSCIPEKILDHADPRQTGKVFHRVRVVKNTRLYGIVNSAAINTNSSHHQVIDKLGKGLQASAFSSDGLIEAIEHSDFDFLIGVQWHPEATIKREHSRRLFKAFVDKALV